MLLGFAMLLPSQSLEGAEAVALAEALACGSKKSWGLGPASTTMPIELTLICLMIAQPPGQAEDPGGGQQLLPQSNKSLKSHQLRPDQ